tara:strand:- start:8027 stop:9379 length:1353 start_codon:yes stop_codon:yes gene_type:complete
MSLKILINPYSYHGSYIRYNNSLAKSFRRLGNEVRVLEHYNDSYKINKILEDCNYDLIIQINRFPTSEVKRSNRTRFITWIQDFNQIVLNSYIKSEILDRDIIYGMGDLTVPGFNALKHNYSLLLHGADTDFIKNFKLNHTQKYDFCFLGDILAPQYIFHEYFFVNSGFEFNNYDKKEYIELSHIAKKSFELKYEPIITRISTLTQKLQIEDEKKRKIFSFLVFTLKLLNKVSLNILNPNFKKTQIYNLVIKLYNPLKGELDLKELIETIEANLKVKLDEHLIQTIVDFPRQLDRFSLINLVLKNNYSLKISGTHTQYWKHFNLDKYCDHNGLITDNYDLINFFQCSKIVLQANCGGYFMLSRVVESMASGGLILTHKSPHDTKMGHALYHFEEGKHFGFYDQNNFAESVDKYLNDIEFREKIILNSYELVSKFHKWDDRALQIINDLKK